MIGDYYDPTWQAFEKWCLDVNGFEVLKTMDRFHFFVPANPEVKKWYNLATDIFELMIENDSDYDGHYHSHNFSKSYPDHDLELMYNRLIPYTMDCDYITETMFVRMIIKDKWLHIDVRYDLDDECCLTVVSSSDEDAKYLFLFFTMFGATLNNR